MKEFVIYTIIICIVGFISIISLNYKRKLLDELNNKEHRLKILYGISCFIFDFIDRYIKKYNYEKEVQKLRKLNINNASEKDAYVYVISRLSLCLFFFYIILGFGYFGCIYYTFYENKEIKVLERPEEGQGNKKYDLIIEKDDQKNDISISVNERLYSEEEISKIFDECFIKINKKLLMNNLSTDCIEDNINLLSSIDNIDIEWDIKDIQYIDYSGNIMWNNINSKVNTTIICTMLYKDYSDSREINLTIINSDDRNNYKTEDKINELINQLNKNKKYIDLSGCEELKEYHFYRKEKNNYTKYVFYAVIFGIMIYFLKLSEDNKKLASRNLQLEMDYSIIVSKLTILQGAGVTLLNAWDKIISDYDRSNNNIRYVYEEMKYARNKMKSGCSEIIAYLEFGRRCGTQSYIKLSNILEQNIRKGTKGMKQILENEVREAFEKRKELAKKKGDEASTKLLLPMGIMLVISIIIVVVPAILSMNF